MLKGSTLLANPHARRGTYPAELRAILSAAKADESRRWLARWSEINPGPTPLYRLSGLAAKLGVAQILLKDESVRSHLGSFKALGAPIALIRLIQRQWPHEPIEPQALFAGECKSRLRGFTVTCATDGNHGRALAAAARSVGCRCVVVLHANVSLEREQAIAACGAEIVRIDANYDESVDEASRLATTNGWHVVSDTSYVGYEDIPRDVMQGYAVIAAEIVEALAGSATPITHAFIQGGVGGLAAAIASYFWEVYGTTRPAIVVVEPQEADCLYQSALHGMPATASGSVDSVMAGLACGKASPLAWRLLMPAADCFMRLADDDVPEAMQALAKGSVADPPIVSGESGVAGVAALDRLIQSGLAGEIGLNRESNVLVINTEGATAPAIYRRLVGESCKNVLSRQKQFMSRGDQPTARYLV